MLVWFPRPIGTIRGMSGPAGWSAGDILSVVAWEVGDVVEHKGRPYRITDDRLARRRMVRRAIPLPVDDTPIASSVFERSQIDDWILPARELALPIDQVPLGWSVCQVDPSKLLNCFPVLQLDQAYFLVAHQYRNADGGAVTIWALPESEYPGRVYKPCTEIVGALSIRPVGGMEPQRVIRGDGSHLSYLSASIFSREANEFCALPGDARWYWRGLSPIDNLPERDINWVDNAHEDLAPRVTVSKFAVMVEFYSTDEEQRIYYHRDLYEPGELNPVDVRNSCIAVQD